MACLKQCQQPFNAQRGTTLIVVVHIDIGVQAFAQAVLNNFGCRFKAFILGQHDAVPDALGFLLDVFPIRPVQTNDQEV